DGGLLVHLVGERGDTALRHDERRPAGGFEWRTGELGDVDGSREVAHLALARGAEEPQLTRSEARRAVALPGRAICGCPGRAEVGVVGCAVALAVGDEPGAADGDGLDGRDLAS